MIACSSIRRPVRAVLLLAPVALGLLALGVQPATVRVTAIPLNAPPDAVALDPGAERAFVASATAGTVSTLDLIQGRVLQRVRVGDPLTLAPLAPALAPGTHRIFVADRTDAPLPSRVYMVDSRTGARLASVQVGHEAAALAVDTRHTQVLVANETDGTLSALDARTGALRRTTSLGLLPLAVAVDERAHRAFVIGPPAAGDRSSPAVLDGGVVGLLGVLDTQRGMLIGRTQLGIGPSALVVDPASGRVFVACTGDDTVRVLDAHSGAARRTVTLPAPPSAAAVDARRARVYVVSAAAGTLSLLDAHSGRLLGTRRIDPFASAGYALPDGVAVDEARDSVYVSTSGPLEPGSRGLTLRGNGTLYVLDARTGAVQRRLIVGVAPQAVVVDEGTGRVVVVNGGGEVVHRPDGWLAPWIGRLRGWLPWLGRFTPMAPSITQVPGSVSVLDPRGL